MTGVANDLFPANKVNKHGGRDDAADGEPRNIRSALNGAKCL